MGAEFRRVWNEALESEAWRLYEVREEALREVEDLITWDDPEAIEYDDFVEW